MNQDFTVKKSNICLKKQFVQRGSPEKKIPAQAVSEKKKSCKLKIPHPTPHHFSNGPSLITKKNLHVQHAFLSIFILFCMTTMPFCTTKPSNFLVTHYFYGAIVVCTYQRFCFLCLCSLLFFHCCFVTWPLAFLICSPPL